MAEGPDGGRSFPVRALNPPPPSKIPAASRLPRDGVPNDEQADEHERRSEHEVAEHHGVVVLHVVRLEAASPRRR